MAEHFACGYLIGKGYWPLARRFKTPVGEIDLVMRRGQQLVFVEVKARATLEAGMAAVAPMSMQRIARAAHWFVAQHPQYAHSCCRYDLVVISPWRWPMHLVQAFN